MRLPSKIREFWPSKKYFFPSRNVLETRIDKKSDEAFAFDSGHCFAFCGINGVFDGKKSVAKQMRIL